MRMAVSSQAIQRTIETFRQAAQANRQTAVRQGNVLQLGPDQADEVMVTADLHGQRLIFHRLCRIADLASHPRRHLLMQEVLHGGPKYPGEQGCMSHLLLEDVARWKVDFPQTFHFLLSNHELAELTEFPIAKGGQILNLQLRMGLRQMYGDALDEVREALAEFLGSCPLAARLANRVFICHGSPADVDRDGLDAGILERPLQPRDLQLGGDAFRLVWGRDFRPANAAALAAVVDADVLIHGHEPCEQGFAVPNDRQIILDCCGVSACYLILPVGEQLTHSQIVERIQRLA